MFSKRISPAGVDRDHERVPAIETFETDIPNRRVGSLDHDQETLTGREVDQFVFVRFAAVDRHRLPARLDDFVVIFDGARGSS